MNLVLVSCENLFNLKALFFCCIQKWSTTTIFMKKMITYNKYTSTF